MRSKVAASTALLVLSYKQREALAIIRVLRITLATVGAYRITLESDPAASGVDVGCLAKSCWD